MKNMTKLIALALVAVMCVALLVACAPASKPADAKAALEKNGYTVVLVDNETALKAAELLAGIDDLVATVNGTKKDGDKIEHVAIYYFEDSEAASEAYDKLVDDSDEEKDDETDWVFKKSGKMVYYGTEAAVKAAR